MSARKPPPDRDALFAAVDALLDEEPQLPPPAERARLREAAGVTQARLAQALGSTVQTVKNWENGRSTPTPPRLEAYQRVLEGWAAKHPAAPALSAPSATPAPPPVEPAAPAPAGAPAATGTRTGRRAAGRRTTPTATSAAYPAGPLLVLDGDGQAYGAAGLVLDCPATTLPALVEWTLTQGVGAPRLHRHGQDADPLVVLTPAAAERYGLPPRLEDRRGLRLPEDHPVVQEIAAAGWQLTRRGLGPWPRIYRPAHAGRRQCVQLAVLPWAALDARSWPGLDAADAPTIAAALCLYAERVTTPRGTTATTGLELMTALRPPTRPVQDGSGRWTSAPAPGTLGTTPVTAAPPTLPAEHPAVHDQWTGGHADEEALHWTRPLDTLTGADTAMPWALGIDVNAAFLAAASRLPVGLDAPHHVVRPTFDRKRPGLWYLDLSAVRVDPRLPSPLTPTGQPPTGPGWYTTPTVQYAVELGAVVEPLEAFLHEAVGAYLDPWHDRLKAALTATLADLGVTRDSTDAAYLEAMAHLKDAAAATPAAGAALTAIKATAKGTIGKLREAPQGRGYRPGQPWHALNRPTYRPDIRASVIAAARVGLHRKAAKLAELTGAYPLGVLSDCIVYPAPTTNLLDLLPTSTSGKVLPGSFRPGPIPGYVKVEGIKPLPWAIDLLEQGLNPAQHIKGDGHDAVLDGGE
ncbi:telomere-associated protein Tap [Streptomyces sp. NPDC059578]|uniref:telomere-associated protein Tap n=1 Tax=Streptomyces sp. NPDC059578 TaxID=3346874 RepID=UPI00369CFC7E